MCQQEKNKETNKQEISNFYLKRELTSFEEIQSGDFFGFFSV